MNGNELPTSVRYVKNGRKGLWWRIALENGEMHLGWKDVPHELLLTPDFPRIERIIREAFGTRPGATQDFNALRDLLDIPSKHIWVTFEDDCMWWCTVRDGAIVNSDREDRNKSNFWLTCDRPWSNKSIQGKRLDLSDLPGIVTTTAGFKGTVCTPAGWQTILRLIRDEKDADALSAADARHKYQQAIHTMVKRLSPKDFEQLVDLILGRSGWARICKLGGSRASMWR